jgi:hypothetical protein
MIKLLNSTRVIANEFSLDMTMNYSNVDFRFKDPLFMLCIKDAENLTQSIDSYLETLAPDTQIYTFEKDKYISFEDYKTLEDLYMKVKEQLNSLKYPD